jgi:uncharacterized protein DUF4333
MRTVALGLALAACSTGSGDAPRLGTDKIESSIRAAMADRGVPLAEVNCPRDRAPKVGDTFKCPGTTTDGQKVTFDVTQTDDHGNLSWVHHAMIVEPAKYAARLAEDKLADVRCAHPAMVVAEDAPVTCDAVSDGKPVKLELQAKNGGLNWVVK